MSPKLSLSYAGGGFNGPVGYGWSVQGASVVTRCPATIATDGRKGGVNFAADDKLCLDGQRLIQLDTTNGNPLVGVGTNDALGLGTGAYREYRTETDSYARIRAYGFANNDSTGASGPAFLKVWSKSGQIYEYGDSPSKDANTKALINVQGKTVAMVWAVSRISDVPGNFIDFKYEQRDVSWGSGPAASSPTQGHEWNLIEIQYSGNKVVFVYDPQDQRVDKSEAYNQGSKNVSVRLLKSITTYINSPNTSALGPAVTPAAVAVKTFNIGYENGPITKRSRLVKIQECAGGPSSTRCLPATVLSYAAGGSETFAASSAFNQAALKMIDASGGTGIIVGDFNGDGKTDFIRWSADPLQNKLYLSAGDGSFNSSSAFAITDNLFTSDGCYVSMVADVNGDGLPDIIRFSSPTSPTGATCASAGPVLIFINAGDGSFVKTNYSGPPLKRDSTANFYFLDVNGDGKVDLVTSVPGALTVGEFPVYRCPDPSGLCMRVYRGNGDGTFSALWQSNLSVYSQPDGNWDINASRYLADLDGDGLVDFVGWFNPSGPQVFATKSRGDGSFEQFSHSYAKCSSGAPIDFNGDGRADCLSPSSSSVAANTLSIGSGPYSASTVSGFDLTHTGQELSGPGVGFAILDVNGDGRHDIVRWKDDPAKNAVYLSNGDGTFCPAGTAATTCPSSGFNFTGVQLKKSDGTANFVIGDFTGHGNVEILRVQTVGTTASNQLYVKQDSTPPDQLVTVTDRGGATTTIFYVPLSNPIPYSGFVGPVPPSANLGPRYASDRGTADAATLPTIDLTFPMYVVATVVNDTGVGTSKVNTEYSYLGLKADTKGRGLLGFREIRRQSPGANGNPLTVDTQYLQFHPYTGAAANSATYNSALNAISSASKLASVVNVYCDQTAAAGSDTTALSTKVSCPVTSVVRRPYLLLSTQTGRDLAGVTLPTVSTQTSVNATGDPTQILVTTTGSTAGVNQTFTKTTAFPQYQADSTGCGSDNLTCSWILGRPLQIVVNSLVPNSLPSIATSAGTGPYATAIKGTATSPLPMSPATLMSILQLLLLDD